MLQDVQERHALEGLLGDHQQQAPGKAPVCGLLSAFGKSSSAVACSAAHLDPICSTHTQTHTCTDAHLTPVCSMHAQQMHLCSKHFGPQEKQALGAVLKLLHVCSRRLGDQEERDGLPLKTFLGLLGLQDTCCTHAEAWRSLPVLTKHPAAPHQWHPCLPMLERASDSGRQTRSLVQCQCPVSLLLFQPCFCLSSQHECCVLR